MKSHWRMVFESGASVLSTKQYFGATISTVSATVAASTTVKNSQFLLKLAFASIVSVPSKAQWRRDRRILIYPIVSERWKIGKWSQRYGYSRGRWKSILLYRNGFTTRLCWRTCYVVINIAHLELQGFEEFYVEQKYKLYIIIFITLLELL